MKAGNMLPKQALDKRGIVRIFGANAVMHKQAALTRGIAESCMRRD